MSLIDGAFEKKEPTAAITVSDLFDAVKFGMDVERSKYEGVDPAFFGGPPPLAPDVSKYKKTFAGWVMPKRGDRLKVVQWSGSKDAALPARMVDDGEVVVVLDAGHWWTGSGALFSVQALNEKNQGLSGVVLLEDCEPA